MADKPNYITTSSNALDGNDKSQIECIPKNQKLSKVSCSHAGRIKMLTSLAENLNQSYQLVKQRQQQYAQLAKSIKSVNNNRISANSDNETSTPNTTDNESSSILDSDANCTAGNGAKNKLKRKKTMSTSLTSVTDSVNQEKRTRIEGIQLNCRGRLQMEERTCHANNNNSNNSTSIVPKMPIKTAQSENQTTGAHSKRRLQDNAVTIHKLTALTEQLRVEINELKSNLHSERGAVRVLRAQNESETRKWKNDVRKLQNTVALLEKSSKVSHAVSADAMMTTATTTPANQIQATGLAPGVAAYNNEIVRLKNEIQMLKKTTTNKNIDEKKLINSEADRRKAADIRLLRDSYEIRLTQLQKSAKTEITRLLEEIKTKERNIGQLKNEVKTLRNKIQKCETKCRNATNKQDTTISSNAKATNKQKSTIVVNKYLPNNGVATIATQTDAELCGSQTLNEVAQLRDVSHFNSTSNFQNNAKNCKTLKPISVNAKTKTATNHNNNSNNSNEQNDCNDNIRTNNSALTDVNVENSLSSYATNCENLQPDENIYAKIEADNKELQELDYYECKIKYNHDSDSALSSAPPSISPQPSPGGAETTNIWQTVRTYNAECERSLKETEALHVKNQNLQCELETTKEKLLQLEKNALECNYDAKEAQWMDRVKHLEGLTNQLQLERDELREQNELLEFRIIELEETNDKWLTQTNTVPATDVWYYDVKTPKDYNSMQQQSMRSLNSSMSQSLTQYNEHLEALTQHIAHMLQKRAYDMEDKECLQQILLLLQQKEIPYETVNSQSVEVSASLSITDNNQIDCGASNNNNPNNNNKYKRPTPAARIVATVQPYNSSEPVHHQQEEANTFVHYTQPTPQNSPNESPRKVRSNLQANSLSESGVFVEYDFLSDSSDINGYAQTDSEQSVSQLLQPHNYHNFKRTTPTIITNIQRTQDSNTAKRLQFYKERLDALESKLLIYESSGDVQAKHLADRLQREIQLEQQVKQLEDRVEYLQLDNAKLEEEKCEFEEAENDTRLRLQRLEVELEILNQRNVELELSREAFCAKYKDCRAECLNLRDDLSASDTQILHLETEKQLVKQNLEFLQDILPLLLIYYYQCILSYLINNNYCSMGNLPPGVCGPSSNTEILTGNKNCNDFNISSCDAVRSVAGCDSNGFLEAEVQSLREEIKCLRHQIRQLNTRHYEALESADSHWSEMEQNFKSRESAQRNKEMCLKQKIAQLQDCLRDHERVANEKVQQMEEQEKDLQQCLVRISKENRDLLDQFNCVSSQYEKIKDELERVKCKAKPAQDELECERKRIKSLSDELSFLRKLHQETELSSQNELDTLRKQMACLKKEYLHIEVTNSELREEVTTLEQCICKLQNSQKECCERIRCLSDEIRTKDEMLHKMERRSERSEGMCLAQELNAGCGGSSFPPSGCAGPSTAAGSSRGGCNNCAGSSPSKRCRRDEVVNLKSAAQCLGQALENIKACDGNPAQKRFQCIANDVKKIADCLLGDEANLSEEKVSKCGQASPCQESPCQESACQENLDKENKVKTENEISVKTEQGENETSIEAKASENVVIKTEPDNDEENVTVGMALMPTYIMPSNMCKCLKPITEVPSELRKLSAQAAKRHKCAKRNSHKKLKTRTSSLKHRVQRVVSNLHQKPSAKETSDLEFYPSEVLQRNISFASFYSAADFINCRQFSQEIIIEKIDKCTETLTPRMDSAVQVDNDINPDYVLLNVPYEIRIFFGMIRSYLPLNTDYEARCFNEKLLELWESAVEFRQGLKILYTFTTLDAKDRDNVTLHNYEHYVKAMKSLHLIGELCKPFNHPMLIKIDELINERLMQFHSRKMDAEFYCQVYYPVKRQAPKLLIK